MEHPTREQSHMHSKSRKRRPKTGIIILCILLVLLLAGLVAALKFYRDISSPAELFQSEATPSPTPDLTPDTTAASPSPSAALSPSPSPTPDPEEVLLQEADTDFMQNRVNILLLGIDESTEREEWGSFRTDTIMLVTIDFETYDVNLISIPRDSYVKIYTANGNLADEADPYAKINSAFSAGGGAQRNGFGYTTATVSKLLGVPVDYYVGFNMNVVKEVVDAMGGVDYEVDIEVTMNGRELHPGFQHLDGQAVLDYCRQRKGSSDIARVGRQQMMVKAILQQLKSTDQIVNIPSIYQAVEQNIMTNLTFKQICSLSLVALNMDMEQFSTYTVEGKSFYYGARDYWGIYGSRLESLLEDIYDTNISVDMDVDYDTVMAQIEQNRLLIVNELNAANNAYSQGQAILQGYASYLDQTTLDTLEYYLDGLEEAIQAEDKALLDAWTPPVEQLNAQIIQALNSGAYPAAQ